MPTGDTDWMELSPETCRASLKEPVEPILLRLVGCLGITVLVMQGHTNVNPRDRRLIPGDRNRRFYPPKYPNSPLAMSFLFRANWRILLPPVRALRVLSSVRICGAKSTLHHTHASGLIYLYEEECAS